MMNVTWTLPVVEMKSVVPSWLSSLASRPASAVNSVAMRLVLLALAAGAPDIYNTREGQQSAFLSNERRLASAVSRVFALLITGCFFPLLLS